MKPLTFVTVLFLLTGNVAHVYARPELPVIKTPAS